MKSVRISSRVVMVFGRGGGRSPKATRREPTGKGFVSARALSWFGNGMLLTVVGAEDLALLTDAGAWFSHGCGGVCVLMLGVAVSVQL